MFSDEQIKIMQVEYAKISRIDPAGDTYKKMIALLDKMTQKMLKQLAYSNINFLSKLAANRVKEVTDATV